MTRSGHCETWSSTTSCRWSPCRPWRRRPAMTQKPSRTRSSRCSDRSRTPSPRTTCAGSTTETYAAMRLDIDNWRWSGVPWFIRTGKKLPATQTELRAIFRDPPRLGFMGNARRRPEPNQFIVKLDPSTGTRVILDAHRADAGGAEAITFDVEFAEQGGEAPTPYEVLLLDAMRGDSTRFTRQDGVEETWRIFQPLLDNPPPVHPYAP